MSEGIQWLAGLENWMSSVVFARGASARELALRLGAAPDGATEPITDAQAWALDMEEYRPDGDGDGVVRVGEHGGWSFALEYGDSTGGDRLAEVSCGGVEAIRYVPIQEHPPATVHYARDGVELCAFGLAEENQRFGTEPDLLLSDLIAGQVLGADGTTLLAPRGLGGEDFRDTYRRTLGVVERRFGLSLPPRCLQEGRLPAYAVRGTPDMRIDGGGTR
ncbi:hypothetical protein GCM10010387_32070 [Streptomyces inusitatus]|uniref:Uncharacterized protein n=1 Tax=Streptomyces inusitatus TaxID=68221 RepID=A0A918UUR0_9ACTN|nr:DUF6461 domain-containing protein [Streptomyces inusitatus]GGZ35586.1 hypothetical protein GCM10010387_32070 [Streptomyces inusitatus]